MSKRVLEEFNENTDLDQDPLEKVRKTDVLKYEKVFEKPTGSAFVAIRNILSVLHLNFVASYGECARIGTHVKYTLELIKKVFLDLKENIYETIRDIKATCIQLHYFDCVRSLARTKLKNFKLEDQFYIVYFQTVIFFEQFGICGSQIIGRY